MSEALKDVANLENWIGVFKDDLDINVIDEISEDDDTAQKLLQQATEECNAVILYGEGLCSQSQLNFTKFQLETMANIEEIKKSGNTNEKIEKLNSILSQNIPHLHELRKIGLEDAELYNEVKKTGRQAKEALRQLGGINEAQRVLSKQLEESITTADNLAMEIGNDLDHSEMKKIQNKLSLFEKSIEQFIKISNTSRSIQNIIDKTPEKKFVMGDTKKKIMTDSEQTLAQCSTEICANDGSGLIDIGKKYHATMQSVYQRALNIISARIPADNYTTTSGELKAAIYQFIDEKLGDAGENIMKALHSRMEEFEENMTEANKLGNPTEKSLAMMEIGKEIRRTIVDNYVICFKKLQLEDENTFNQYIDNLMEINSNIDADQNTELMAQAAIIIRFNLPIHIEENMITKKTPLLYKTLQSVPSHHLNHDKLMYIELYKQPQSSHNYYSASEAKISLNAVNEADSQIDYAPDNGDAIKLSYYTSTALHEVGHSVDAKLSYMKNNQSNPNFGQWQENEDPNDIAKKMITKHNLTAQFIESKEEDLISLFLQLLEGITPNKPANIDQPLGSLRNHWSDLKSHQAWEACANAGNTASPWYGGEDRAKKLTLNGRVYHEAYTDDWVSYAFSERAATGISDYQWRAPGEWFAEIYALHFSGKLAENHPMYQAFTTDPKLSGASAL